MSKALGERTELLITLIALAAFFKSIVDGTAFLDEDNEDT